MKKMFLIVLTMLTLATNSYAQVARNASDATISHIRSSFTNIGVTGLDVSGNPGYIAMVGANANSTTGYFTEYYLWVSNAGNLCIASWPVIQAYASFPNGNWNTDGIPCSKVGSQ